MSRRNSILGLAAVAILVALAAPTLVRFIQNARMSGEAAAFAGDLHYARSEAIRQGVNVSMCPSTNGSACSGGLNWEGGWVVFTDADGRPATLAAFSGRVVLLNLWATWCGPCRKEMPALDRLQQNRGNADFEVVAVNLDTRDPEKPKTFLAETGVKALAFRSDASFAFFRSLQSLGLARGLPTTILLDRRGCELGVMAGPAAWDGPEAVALIDRATK